MTTELIQWEYRTEDKLFSILREMDMLQEYGKLGFQLCATVLLDSDEMMMRYYFKRPIIQSPAKQEP